MEYSEYVSLLHQYAEKAQEHVSIQEQDKVSSCHSFANLSVTDVVEVPSLPIHWVVSTEQGSSAPLPSTLNDTQLIVGLFDNIVYTSWQWSLQGSAVTVKRGAEVQRRVPSQ